MTDTAGAAADFDDRELIQRCQDGDIAAFEPLVQKYRQRVWRLAYQILRDREEAWDCAQEAFVRAYSSLSSFRGQSAFYTWLFRITVNVATDRHRSRGARTRAFGEPVPEEEWERTALDVAEGPEDAALQAEERARIERALDSLPPKARTIIILSDIEGLSYREIAAVLNCPMGTVMSRLHNARKRLRDLLGPLLALVLWLGLAITAAGPAAAGDALVNFGVRVLQASNPSATVASPPMGRIVPAAPELETDERLQRILPRLRNLFRYSEYTTIDRQRAQVTVGTQQRFTLPGARQLEVVPDELLGGQAVRMRVRLLKGEQPELRAAIVAAPGAPAVFGGPSHGDGVLIIILWAYPAPDR